MLRYFTVAICIAVCVAGKSRSALFDVMESLHKLPPVEKQTKDSVEWGTIDQLVDNFDSSNTATYKMRYISNEDNYKPGGPIFVMIGGEWSISSSYLLGGQMYDNAKMHNGAMFYTEHRYYGSSYPTSDASVANLKYLSAEQALADLAYFIKQQKNRLGASKVIVFGGSYAANLASWVRLKYPDLIDGAIASSGPVKAQADFKEYLEVVNTAINDRDPECLNIIKTAMQTVDSLAITPSGCQKITKTFNLCRTLIPSEMNSVAVFYEYVTGSWSGLVQYAQGNMIEDACAKLKNSAGENEMEKLANYLIGSNPNCFNAKYDDYVEYMNITSWEEIGNNMMRQWTYQTCTEYGYYQTTNSPNQPFGRGLPLAFSFDVCKDVFGVSMKNIYEGIEKTNDMYQNTNPSVTNVVYVNGDVDPWHRLSILEDVNSQTPAYFVHGTSHCADLQSISSADNEEMKQAKLNVQVNIKKWLQ